MNFTKSESIGDLLVQHIPKELILALQEAFLIGSTRAYHGVEHTHPGHVKNVLGQLRHFELNEAFHTVMQSHNLEVSELKGNNIVVAKSGIWNICRATANDEKWHAVKRSRARQLLAHKNMFIESLVYRDLFEDNVAPLEGTVFFVTSFSGSMDNMPEQPVSIQIAVCDSEMNNWLFVEHIEQFLERYSVVGKMEVEKQIDLAKPSLKKKGRDTGTLG
ncbi:MULTISPECIES: hypothetical protein [Neisseria]|uniref:hypothetical protein n=1 Tax=Neisseria TaxID=482 RepID=UPI0008A18258|nr:MULTISPECIES: hypothetical protein [Neisseria]DAN84260.1 MAG TPA: hypothetical protein [Caudoviricetes sp.]OFO27700.1 hypothetical protein HMPREF3052_08295 [Neisseria sp. HMSC056A03]DAR97848.1 MAG TPA: hypothetical protein [Caudoviricetes sp.]DAS45795.1 MAG TPA: hypothetical protein [Caudoviricetes sp.]DAX40948.1 MAG TPA: hypothetical protein [Caudoviricetes sp.]